MVNLRFQIRNRSTGCRLGKAFVSLLCLLLAINSLLLIPRLCISDVDACKFPLVLLLTPPLTTVPPEVHEGSSEVFPPV